MHLDRITSSFINKLSNTDSKPLYEMEITEARNFLTDIQRSSKIDIDTIVFNEYIETDNGKIELQFVRPRGSENEILPVILYVHGGGWILGDFETHSTLIKKLANCTYSCVVFVNYSRSPEAQYPQALDEIYLSLNYVYENSKKFNINPYKIVIAGDSAGGNMAAATCIRTQKEQGPKIAFQLLLYPVTDASMKTESYKLYKDGPWLTKKAMEWFWDAYLPEKKERESIYVSLNNADIADLENLPPALIITAENDVLRDEGEEYARKLDEAGVDVISVRINNTHHDFMMLNALFESLPVNAAFHLVCSVLNCKLNE